MINNKLTGRGKAMIVAAPTLFGVSDVLFHANPIVALAIGALGGIVAYRHWDDIDAGLEQLAAGTIQEYEPRSEGRKRQGSNSTSGKAGRGKGQPSQMKDSEWIINQLIPIGKQPRNGQTFARSLKSFKNIIILGLQGGGKSNTAIHILKHCVRNGCRLAVIDKHARAADDSLSVKIAPWQRAFICPAAGTPDQALGVVDLVRSVMDHRLEDGEKPEYPLILVVDEYSAIMRQKEDGGRWQEAGSELAGLLEDIVTEGRKCQIFCICIGQIANVTRTGGSEIRELFPTRIAHGMSPKQATMFGFGEQKNLFPGLGQGEIFIQAEGMAEPLHLKVRYEEEGDITTAAERIPDHEPLEDLDGDDQDLEDDDQDLEDDEGDEGTQSGDLKDDRVAHQPTTLPRKRKPKQLPPLRKSKEQQKQEELERAINAYQEGARTIEDLQVALNYETYSPARTMMARVRAELKKRETAASNG